MNLRESPLAERQTSGTHTSQDIVEGILNASRGGILIVDAFMRVEAANEAAREAFARPVGPLEGRRLSEVIRDPNLHEAFRRALTALLPSELRIEFPGADKRIYDVHIAPLRSGDILRAIGFFHDITQVELLEKVRQEFLSNISH